MIHAATYVFILSVLQSITYYYYVRILVIYVVASSVILLSSLYIDIKIPQS